MKFKNKMSKTKIAFAKQMRNNPTKAEAYLFKFLKGKQIGAKVYRQKPMFGYIVDFYCPKYNFIIELDGPSHDKTKCYDKKRDQVFQSNGIKVLRFYNYDVINNTSIVLHIIKLHCLPL